jgi:2-methylisocitrate lyase-like PEP mutase family enzyme
MKTQMERGTAFRELHARTKPFVIPNAYDAGTAKLLASLGFEALATTSAGFAFAFGRQDGEMDREATLENGRAICASTDLPVSADLENCFADDPRQAAETIRGAAAVGLVGGSIEDATGNDSAPIYDFTLAVERVHAAAEVAHALPFPFTLTARAENFLHGHKDLDDTIRRLEAYEKAGADVLYAPMLPNIDAIRAVIASVSKPVNVLVSSGNAGLTYDALAQLGVRRISVGGALARAALTAVANAAREMKERGTFTYGADLIPVSRLNEIFAEKR